MKAFSRLLERLYYEHSTLGKERLLLDYFRETPDPDRGYAVAIRRRGLTECLGPGWTSLLQRLFC